jgi:hypothetical protein
MVDMNYKKDGISINNVFTNELTVSFLKETLGNTDFLVRDEKFKDDGKILKWDDKGIVAYVDKDEQSIRSLYLYLNMNRDKTYFDTPKSNFNGTLSFGGKTFIEKIPPKKLESTYIFIDKIRFGDWVIDARVSDELHEKIKLYDFGKERAEIIRNAQYPFTHISIEFKPKRVSSGKYDYKDVGDNILSFDNFNFKLAIIQVLMYDKKLIEPKFNVFEFAEDYSKREIDVEYEGYKPIREVKKWFENLPINAELAQHIEELYFDGGNEIYGQIIPFWDGEDSYYDIKNISSEELVQFPELKSVDIQSWGLSKKVKYILNSKGIKIIE